MPNTQEVQKTNQKINDLLVDLGLKQDDTIVENPLSEELLRSQIEERIRSEQKRRINKYSILKEFLQTKKLEGCSNKTLKLYYDIIFRLLMKDGVHPCDMNTAYLRSYLAMYQEERKITNSSLDNMRRVFSSFFSYLEDEGYIIKNPVNKIHRIKVERHVKKPFTDEEIEMLRDACRDLREICIVDFLNSSGVRVSELCSLNIDDINLSTREGVVFGKGNKQRIIYFDAKSKIHISRYLSTRIDDNPALFVSKKYPFKRMQKSGIEIILREIGDIAGVENVHPHRFRRTLATNLINKGVPIEQVQQILGHTKIDTTLLYAVVNQENVKINHSRHV